jgi:positive regulator of sigma E activity
MTSDEVKGLLAAAEDAEERCRRYGRRAALFARLALALYVVAAVAYALTVAAYLLYSWWQVVVASTALWTAGYASYMLHDHYSRKAAKAARQSCIYRKVAEIVAEIERIKPQR